MYSTFGSYLSPDAISTFRRVTTSQSTTGEDIWTVSQVFTSIGLVIDSVPAPSLLAGHEGLSAAGVLFTATHTGFIQGISTAQIPAGASPGATVSVGGIGYLVDGTGLNAYPDIQPDDKAVDLLRYRVFFIESVVRYPSPFPCLQCNFQEGRVW